MGKLESNIWEIDIQWLNSQFVKKMVATEQLEEQRLHKIRGLSVKLNPSWYEIMETCF